MKTRLFIFGTGAHARKVFHYAQVCGYEVMGFVDENAVALAPIPGMQVFHVATMEMPIKGDAMFVAIGHPEVRMRLMDLMAAAGWNLPALVHPSAWVAPDVELGPGVLVGAGAVVETASLIGRGVIVDIGVMVDHECEIGAFSHLRPGVVCGPRTKIAPAA